MACHKVGNYRFQWTDLHLFPETLKPLRQHDQLGSYAVNKLQQISRDQKGAAAAGEQSLCHGPFDVYATLRDHHAEDKKLNELWEELHTVPEWVDWEQLKRGQRFFFRYAAANLVGFALQGFIGQNSSTPSAVEVLARTGSFSTRVLLRRLLETTQFILEATHSVESIQPGGPGHTTAIRVRLLHSAPSYFDVENLGIPVNLLDSIHSTAAFCCGHMWFQLPQMGVYPTLQEAADYIALWRYLGYLQGVPDGYFSSVAQAKVTMESMVLHELKLTPTSLIVGHNFVECVKDLPPVMISAGFIEAGSRMLNGHKVCDGLGFGRPGPLAYACWRGHCWFVGALALAQQWIPAIDEAMVAYWRKTLNYGVFKSKGGLQGGSKMEFKYVPQLGKTTKREDNGRVALGSFMAAPLEHPLEAFYFAVFLVGCVLICGSLFGFYWGVRKMVNIGC
ncbi:hypothetical protein ACQKWADRAFT_325742 [Trichoderma austrokoningii]